MYSPLILEISLDPIPRPLGMQVALWCCIDDRVKYFWHMQRTHVCPDLGTSVQDTHGTGPSKCLMGFFMFMKTRALCAPGSVRFCRPLAWVLPYIHLPGLSIALKSTSVFVVPENKCTHQRSLAIPDLCPGLPSSKQPLTVYQVNFSTQHMESHIILWTTRKACRSVSRVTKT